MAFRILALSMTLPLITGCLLVRTEHRIEPIHITVDVNLRVQEELDDVFGDLDRRSTTRSHQESSNPPQR